MKKGMLLSMVVMTICLFCTLVLAGKATAADEDILKRAQAAFGPLPEVMASEKNPITPEKVALGKMLFYEKRISIDGTVSCEKCHPFSLYAADGLRRSIGNNYKVNPRNAPTILNVAGQISEHWVGNRTDVEDQARQSVTGPPAYGMPSNEAVEKKLKEFKGYRELFKKVFPEDKEPVTVNNFALAVGAFERTLITPSPFDAFLKGKKEALSEQEKGGLKTFMEAGCGGCHSGVYLGGQMYQKFGLVEPYAKYTRSEKIDEGRYAVTKNEADKYVFKVPILRNVEMTPPYFHDGSIDTLEEAVAIMGKVQLGKDLTKEQTLAITIFLKSLTGVIAEDVLRVPVLPAAE